MARKGENIYKRKDGRWEGRYIKSRSSTGKANTVMFMQSHIEKSRQNLSVKVRARVILSLSIQKLAQINLNRLLWNGFKLYVLK